MDSKDNKSDCFEVLSICKLWSSFGEDCDATHKHIDEFVHECSHKIYKTDTSTKQPETTSTSSVTEGNTIESFEEDDQHDSTDHEIGGDIIADEGSEETTTAEPEKKKGFFNRVWTKIKNIFG